MMMKWVTYLESIANGRKRELQVHAFLQVNGLQVVFAHLGSPF